jgi:hypothetical protein
MWMSLTPGERCVMRCSAVNRQSRLICSLWDNFTGPQAKAHHLLRDLDLGGAGSALRQAGQVIFENFGGSPGNSYTWVELRDDLTVSLLQARLIELNLPINVAVGTRGWEADCGICSRNVGIACLAGSGGQSLLFRPWGLMFPEQPLVSERLKSAGGQIALSHKGRYWQISGLEKQVALDVIILY